jgi:hypothetical protein
MREQTAQDGDLDGNSAEGSAYVRRVFARLKDVTTRRWTYLQVARWARDRSGARLLTDSEYHVLIALTECARADLTSSFPSARMIAQQEHLSERHVKRILSALVDKGWLRRPVNRGGLNGSNGPAVNQFCVPAGAIKPWAGEWIGPVRGSRKKQPSPTTYRVLVE